MILKISSELHDQLLEKPESGMGYQVAIIQNKPLRVFNTQFAYPFIYAPSDFPGFSAPRQSQTVSAYHFPKSALHPH